MTTSALPDNVLESVCQALGTELTGGQIGDILARLGVDDGDPTGTKWRRLFAALSQRQQLDKNGNKVGAFIEAAMDPVRYVVLHDSFETTRVTLATALSFAGLTLGPDGKLQTSSQPVSTLDEAVRRASRLRSKLEQRDVHPDVLTFCRSELLEENYFHAVFEATKSVADKIRDKSGSVKDGSKLVDETFPVRAGSFALATNDLRTEGELSEQKGLANLIRGMFGTFRNTLAHVPKIKWVISEEDALDLLTLASFLHRRLDRAVWKQVPKRH
jgi:uncharacterized protein (TIGR02391 family)